MCKCRYWKRRALYCLVISGNIIEIVALEMQLILLFRTIPKRGR